MLMKLLENLRKCESILNLLAKAVSFFVHKNKKVKSTAPGEPRIVRRTTKSYGVIRRKHGKGGFDATEEIVPYEEIVEEFEAPDDKQSSDKSDDK